VLNDLDRRCDLERWSDKVSMCFLIRTRHHIKLGPWNLAQSFILAIPAVTTWRKLCIMLLMSATPNEKSTRRDTNTVVKAEPKIFAPPQTPFPGGTGRPKFNQLEMVAIFTYRPSLVKINACNVKLSW